MTNKKSSKPRRAAHQISNLEWAAVAAGAWPQPKRRGLPKGKPNISNWKGIEKNIFDYILLNVSYETFYDIEYDYCFVLAAKGFYPTSPLDINKNKVVCNFFAKQSFF